VVAGDGQTWFLPSATLADPPSTNEIAVAEALARGEIDDLGGENARLRQMPNGETPIAFAARFGQQHAIRWLLEHEAVPDIVALWKMGFRDEAVLAASDPRWLNIQRGSESTTPLHEAIRGNHPDLARMLIAAGADLSIRDTQWHGRPLDWANALGRPEVAAIIQRAM
jgi:ankyrin repeat protein